MHRSDQRLRGHRLRKHAREVVEIEVGGIAAGDDDDRNVAGGVVSSHLPADVFAALASSHAEFGGLSYDTIALRGLPIHGATAAPAAAGGAR